ncbi:MAG: hypothetical protein ACOX1X_01875 [Dethiobacteria bacterium]
MMQACLRCGRKTEGDCLIWKGGVNRVLCPGCAREEKNNLLTTPGETNKKSGKA